MYPKTECNDGSKIKFGMQRAKRTRKTPEERRAEAAAQKALTHDNIQRKLLKN